MRGLGADVAEFDVAYGPEQDLRFYRGSFEQFDFVYFLAWDVGGSKYLWEKDSYDRQYQWNLMLLDNLIPKLAKQPERFVFISSQLADKVDFPYGITKRIGEQMTTSVGGRVLRLWNVYGKMEETTQRSHVVSDMIRQAVETGNIRLRSNGQELRRFVHYEDVNNVLEKIENADPGEIYDVAPHAPFVKIIDVARLIAEYTGASLEVPYLEAGETFIPEHNFPAVPYCKTKHSIMDGICGQIDAFLRDRSSHL